MIALTDAQRELLEDKFLLWDRAAREGYVELRDYNRRAADALKTALALASSVRLTNEVSQETHAAQVAGEGSRDEP